MISLSFVDQDGVLLSGINGQQLAESGTVRLRIVADIMGVASYDVTLTGPDGTSQTASVIYDPVAFVDQGTAADQLDFANLADGDYSLSVEAKDGDRSLVSTQTGAFTLGEPFAPRIEAEDASLGAESDASTGTMAPTAVDENNGSVTDSAQLANASNGSFVDFSGEPDASNEYNVGGGEWVEWTVNAPEAGEYDIAFGYAFHSGGADNRPMRLDVNDNLFDRVFDFPDTGDNAIYDEATTRVSLAKGENTIRLTSNGFSGPNVDYLDVRPADPTTFVFPAEDLALTGGNAAIDAEALTDGSDTYRFGAENGAYLDWAFGSEAANATAPFTFDAPGAGTYAVRVTYAGSNDRPLDLALVDEDSTTTVGTFAFVKTDGLRKLPDDLDDLPDLDDGSGQVQTASEADLSDGWEGWTVEEQTVTLDAGGPTTLQLQTPSTTNTGPNIDKIEVVLQALDPVAPSAVSLGNDSVLENAAGAAIGRVLVEDTDNSTHTITVSEDGESSESTRFEVENGVLKLQNGVTLDHESESSIDLTVTATDSEGSVSTTATVLVGDVNEAPTLATGTSLDAKSVAAGDPASIDLTGLGKNDPDDGDTAAYGARLRGDGDLPEGLSVNGSSLDVGTGLAAGSYTVDVFATDGELESAPVALDLTVTDSPTDPAPFTTTYLQGEDLTILDAQNSGSVVRSTTGDATDGSATTNPEDSAVFGGENDNTGPQADGNEYDPYGLPCSYP